MRFGVDFTIVFGMFLAMGIVFAVPVSLVTDLTRKQKNATLLAISAIVVLMGFLSARVSYIEARSCGKEIPTTSKLCD